ncbi:hypothetical protein JTB14_028365 [Gonioctena quinquepunctata]|nr:hypothetical protein JTB14_028365 [Gonioctena quinquepunctata]
MCYPEYFEIRDYHLRMPSTHTSKWNMFHITKQLKLYLETPNSQDLRILQQKSRYSGQTEAGIEAKSINTKVNASTPVCSNFIRAKSC